MIIDQELDAVIRAGLFRDREHAIHEAIDSLFVVRPHLRIEAAIELFRSGEVSLLRGAEIAGLDFESFRTLLRDRWIPREIEARSGAEMDKAFSEFLGESPA